jgi:curved DNA-binding protein CbpA
MKASFFDSPVTLEELKSQYHRLAFIHHPDRGGDIEIMKAINAEYDFLHELLKNTHMNGEGTIFRQRADNEETPEEFRDLIERLVRMAGLTVELIGAFIWITGNTREHKETLKEMGFRWSKNKIAWYLKPDWYHRRSLRNTTLKKFAVCTVHAALTPGMRAGLCPSDGAFPRPAAAPGRPEKFLPRAP